MYTYNVTLLQTTEMVETQQLRQQQPANTISELTPKLSGQMRRFIELASEKGSSSWFTTLPITDFGVKLHRRALFNAQALRNG